MGSIKDDFGARSTFTGVNVPVSDLCIVGIDCDASEYPDLADPDRIILPLDEDLITSIDEHGIKEDVKIRMFKNDPHKRKVVITGRQRVRNGREAQKRRKERGEEIWEITAPCKIESTGDPLAMLVIENEYRHFDSPLAKARKAARYKAAGHSDADTARLFGVSVPCVKAWWDMLASGSETLGALAAGTITAKAATAIGGLAPKDQAAALATAKSTKGQAQAEQVRKLKKEQKAKHKAGDNKPADARETSAKMTAAQVKQFVFLTTATEEEPYKKGDENIELTNAVLRAMLGEGPAALKGYDDVQKIFRKALKPAD